MNWVEILGPAGIGKTTFLNMLANNRSAEDKWVLQNEALLEISKQLKISNISLSRIVALVYLKQNLTDVNKLGLSNKLLDKKKAFIEEGFRYNHLIEAYIKQHINNPNTQPFQKAYRISLYTSIIERLTICDYYKYQKLVVFDEGPINHNPGLNNIHLDRNKLLPKAIIYCDLDEANILTRIKERAKRGNLANIHRGLNEKELQEHIVSSLRSSALKMELMSELGVPTYKINLKGIPSKSTLDEINSFLIAL